MNHSMGTALRRLFAENEQMRNYNGYLSVKQGERIVYEGGFGYADYENKVRATGDTIYLIGSMTKSITATCIMMLVQQGLIGLEDKITRYFPHYSTRVVLGSGICWPKHPACRSIGTGWAFQALITRMQTPFSTSFNRLN